MLHELFAGWQTPLFTVAKSLALFLTAAVAFRFAQRRTIAEFTPFDWVTAVAVGAIVGRVATAADTSWSAGAAALLTLLAAHGVTARLRFFGWFRRLVDPPVRVLVRDGVVDDANLKRAGLTRSDLDAILRQHAIGGPRGTAAAMLCDRQFHHDLLAFARIVDILHRAARHEPFGKVVIEIAHPRKAKPVQWFFQLGSNAIESFCLGEEGIENIGTHCGML